MRRTEFLLTEVRNATDNTDVNGVKNAEIIGYYNDGQRYIENLIFKSNPKANLFKGVVEYDTTSDNVYTLPTDILGINALSLVEGKFGTDTVNDGYRTITQIDESEQATLFGYLTRDNSLILTNKNIFQQIVKIRVTYFKQLPRIDIRHGKILTVNSGVSLVMNAGYDDLAYTIDENITVVDKFGAQVLKSVFIDTFTAATWATTNTLTGVVANQYVCMGKNSINAGLLPEACETYLQDYVKQRIYTRNVYEDAEKQIYFTTEQKKAVEDLFKNNQKDTVYPPISDTTFLEF